MPDLMNWLRQYIPSSGFPAESPSGAPVEWNSWDHPWWFMVNTEQTFNGWADQVRNVSPDEMYGAQPHIRTVVDFLARNVAQLGLHTFKRLDDHDRERVRDTTVARLLSSPNPEDTTFDLIYGTVADMSLYDKCYWWVQRSLDTKSGWVIVRLPVGWVTTNSETPFGWKEYWVTFPGTAGKVKLNQQQLIIFHGYDPNSLHRGNSPINALKDTLLEEIEAMKYRQQVWKRGGRVSAVITRPPKTPWDPAARRQFTESWKSKFTGSGSDAGGTPILEDGMTIEKMDFSAQDQQFIEGVKLSLVTVASAYHVNPTMVGENSGANYSNVREFRKMLYGDTLGPLIEQIQQKINQKLIPMVGEDNEREFVEFNVDAKLSGNFEEQAAVLSTSVGAPWMTRNEARARRNLPAIEGEDELITPLNVIKGGQASPQDSGTQNVDPSAQQPDQAPKHYVDRVKRSVTPKLKSGLENWFDFERWDRELAQDTGLGVEDAHVVNEQIKKEVEECS